MNYREQYEYDLQAQYEAYMEAQAQAEAEYEAEMYKMKIESIHNLEQLIERKQSEIDQLKEEIQRLKNML